MNRNFIAIIIVSALTSVVSVVSINYFMRDSSSNRNGKSDGSMFRLITANPRPLAADMPDFSDVAENVTSAVVNIKATIGGNELLENLWGSGSASLSSGSGVVIAADGYIITNHHVIERSSQIEVTLSDKRTYGATVVGDDEASDLALLKINAPDKLSYLDLGNSDALRVGQWVLAVGNPFNLSSTVTAGIVSAKGRNIDILEGDMSAESFIQTDAAVNPGNSGGALVNTEGKLIGINTAIMTRTGTYEGYSFAIPSNMVKKVVKDLRDYGMVQRAYFGIVPGEVTPITAQKYKLKQATGIYIAKLTKGGAAQEAGLQEGDVIIKMDNVVIDGTNKYQQQLATYRPGVNINIEYMRDGQPAKLVIKLKNQNNNATLIDQKTIAMLTDMGLECRDLTDVEYAKLKTEGVLVTAIRPSSKIAQTNMERNFVISKLNGRTIKSKASFVQALESASGKVQLDGFYTTYKGNYAYSFVK